MYQTGKRMKCVNLIFKTHASGRGESVTVLWFGLGWRIWMPWVPFKIKLRCPKRRVRNIEVRDIQISFFRRFHDYLLWEKTFAEESRLEVNYIADFRSVRIDILNPVTEHVKLEVSPIKYVNGSRIVKPSHSHKESEWLAERKSSLKDILFARKGWLSPFFNHVNNNGEAFWVHSLGIPLPGGTVHAPQDELFRASVIFWHILLISLPIIIQ